MTNLRVKRFTEDELVKLRDQYPDAGIKQFQLVDEKGTVIDYFDTEQEAQSVLDDLAKRSLVESAFRCWVERTTKLSGIPREEVVDIVKDCC